MFFKIVAYKLQALIQSTKVTTMGNQRKQLTLKERYQIEAFCKLNFSARKMAKELGPSNKTISNEFIGSCIKEYCAAANANMP